MNQSNYIIPVSIIAAATIIAVAVILSGGNNNNQVASNSDNLRNNPTHDGAADNPNPSNIRPVSSEDHILGDPNAPITIVEYSDFECPFCQRVHPTLKRVVNDYSGDVKWVYRHFPLTNIHRSAQSAAVASECIAKLGGNDAFWQFTDKAFNNQSNLNQDFYKTVASNLGLDVDQFNSCLSDKTIISEVNADRLEATSSGGRGTPFSIIMDKNGNTTPVSGALPYETWQQIIDGLI